MSSLVIAGVLLAVFVLGVAISQWRSEQAERLYDRIEFWRKLISVAIAILLVGTFVQSGNTILLVLAGLMALFAALYVAVEKPHKELV